MRKAQTLSHGATHHAVVVLTVVHVEEVATEVAVDLEGDEEASVPTDVPVQEAEGNAAAASAYSARPKARSQSL
jgi:hypothetical protein